MVFSTKASISTAACTWNAIIMECISYMQMETLMRPFSLASVLFIDFKWVENNMKRTNCVRIAGNITL